MQEIAKSILRELERVLEPESFRRKKNRFFRETREGILWIEVQKSRRSTGGTFIFTVNLGAFLPILAKALGEDIREIDILNGHWNARLGELLPSPEDSWWEVASAHQGAVVGREVAALLRRYGLPALQRAGSVEGLIGFFETGLGIMYAGSRREEILSALKRIAASGVS